jgi:hypothetical protein
MSIVDRIFVGKVVKDFGVVSEKSLGIGKIRHSALLVEKYGRLYFVIKNSTWFLLSTGVSYHKFPIDDASKIRDYISESETIVKTIPPLDYDISKLALRFSLITMAVASAINLFTQDSGLIFLTTFIATFFHANQYLEFYQHPDVDSRTKKLLFVIPLITFLIAIPKFCWLTIILWRQ